MNLYDFFVYVWHMNIDVLKIYWGCIVLFPLEISIFVFIFGSFFVWYKISNKSFWDWVAEVLEVDD